MTFAIAPRVRRFQIRTVSLCRPISICRQINSTLWSNHQYSYTPSHQQRPDASALLPTARAEALDYYTSLPSAIQWNVSKCVASLYQLYPQSQRRLICLKFARSLPDITRTDLSLSPPLATYSSGKLYLTICLVEQTADFRNYYAKGSV